MFIATLFIIPPNWKQPKCSSGDEQLNKLLYPHNGILLSNKKGTDCCYPATWMSLTNMQNERSQAKMVHYNIWLNVALEQAEQIFHDRKQISGCLGLRIDCKYAQGNIWDDGKGLHLIFVVVTQVYTFVDLHQTVFFTWVYFTICKLYLNKVSFMAQPSVTFFPFSLKFRHLVFL